MTVEEMVARINESYLSEIKYLVLHQKEWRATRLARMRQHLEILPRLEEAVGKENLSTSRCLDCITIRLGRRPSRWRKKEFAAFTVKLVALRLVLGRLHMDGKSLDYENKDVVNLTLRSEMYKGVSIEYGQALPKNDSKCRVVRVVRHELVCDS